VFFTGRNEGGRKGEREKWRNGEREKKAAAAVAVEKLLRQAQQPWKKEKGTSVRIDMSEESQNAKLRRSEMFIETRTYQITASLGIENIIKSVICEAKSKKSGGSN
jgi:hypothetical protein